MSEPFTHGLGRYSAERPERQLAEFLLDQLRCNADRLASLSVAYIELVEETGKNQSVICILLPDDSGFTVTVKRVEGKKGGLPSISLE